MDLFETLGEYFEQILFALLLFTLVMWLLDKFYFEKNRRNKVKTARLKGDDSNRIEAHEKLNEHSERQPLWLEYTAGFFPVILVVFVLRSFIAEPFKIPSGSMMPTLLIGDLILVNKYTYGIRVPIVNTKIIEIGEPQRGDVMVFRYPKNPAQKYIKRVIGLPGDVVTYQNKHLTINGKKIEIKSEGEYFDEEHILFSDKFNENLGKIQHSILINKERSASIQPEIFPLQSACRYISEGIECKVPPGHYFVMGDNRDNSLDSRYWGFVPQQNIVGRAFFIWMNFGNLRRIGVFH